MCSEQTKQNKYSDPNKIPFSTPKKSRNFSKFNLNVKLFLFVDDMLVNLISFRQTFHEPQLKLRAQPRF